ncbi:FUSC family protein [Salinimonas chungwhensis]|uniref:FUSC family protein n=1 Tax=Salinimonas chungwhensis TaxID=265425 RepID=UPI000378E321|nr:FUSC family protein [Salinimonas chungwhensis]
MQLPLLAATYLTPSRDNIIFAFKGVLAMAMALYISLYFNLEKPYWAVVSAVFLQVRPEGGLVVEKTVSQITGTLIGGIFGLFVLNYLHAAPMPAMGTLAAWLALNSTLSALVRRVNFIYFFAMACVTPCIIVLLTMAAPELATNQTIFGISQARITEIIVGALCAMTVSMLVFPKRIKTSLQAQAKTVINQTLHYVNLELDREGSHEDRHQCIDEILESLATLNDDSSAVAYEGPQGPGRARAASVISNKTLSVVAVIQIFGRLQRNHSDIMSGTLSGLLDVLREDLKKIASTRDYQTCYEIAQAQRRSLLKISKQSERVTPLEARLLKTAHEMLSELVLILRAYNTLMKGHESVLKAPEHRPYRDPLIALATGFRTFLVFGSGATLWLYTGSPAAIMVMILPVIFSIMFARLPPIEVKAALKKMLVGVTVAIPVAIFFALNLLAQSSGDYALLILILSGPYFLGLMAISQRETRPYGLGFCIPFTLLVQPANDMSRPLSVDYTLSAAIAIIIGVSILYWVFRLVTGPGVETVQGRLLAATRRDLQRLIEQPSPAHWFNARMGDRLLRLASYDKDIASDARVITDLGLTGLNLGHTSIRVRTLVQTVTDKDLSVILKHWQYVLADTFIDAAKGRSTERFKPMCDAVLAQVRQDSQGTAHLTLIEGIFKRLDLTFQRTAMMVQQKNTEIRNN